MDSFLSKQPSLFVQDGKLGSSERSCVHVRSISNDPLTSLLLQSITVFSFYSTHLDLDLDLDWIDCLVPRVECEEQGRQ